MSEAREIPYEDDPQYVRVACVACGSTRSSRWEECFCHETRTKKPPQDAPSLTDLLLSYGADPRQGGFRDAP